MIKLLSLRLYTFSVPMTHILTQCIFSNMSLIFRQDMIMSIKMLALLTEFIGFCYKEALVFGPTFVVAFPNELCKSVKQQLRLTSTLEPRVLSGFQINGATNPPNKVV